MLYDAEFEGLESALGCRSTETLSLKFNDVTTAHALE